jgi:hypothetical protein|tara:strand:- start:352 stop:912 length:561 start_codon:yes stop_codon:yes gene_type:complete
MPLIKDKDRYKKLSARDRGRGRVTEDSNLPNKSINTTQRKRQDFAEERKLKESKSSGNFNSVKSIQHAASITNVFTLSKGQTLEKFLIVNGTGSATIDLHWSDFQQKDLTFESTETQQIIETNARTTRLFRRSMSAYDSFGGANDTNAVYKTSAPFEIKDLFSNVDRDIYFYLYTSAAMHVTYIIT